MVAPNTQSQALAPVGEARAILPQNFGELQNFAATVAKSSLLAGIKPEDAFVIIAKGMELGLAPMQALTGIYVVKGRPAMAADMMVALCVSRPSVCKYFRCVRTNDEVAEYETMRAGDPAPTRISFSIADAKRAGLGGGNWSSYPSVMLRHRAASQLARAVYPDLVMGLYEEDEARAIDMRETTPGVYAPVSAPPPAAPVDQSPSPDFLVALEYEMLGSRSLDDLRAASDKVRAAGLTQEQTAHFRAIYADCRAKLEKELAADPAEVPQS